MSLPSNIADLLVSLRKGDQEAADRVWEHFFTGLCRVAQRRLASQPFLAADEEDVALSALDSVCRRLQRGDYPDVVKRDDLWRLLVTVTQRKAATVIRNETRQKRGGRRPAGSPGFAADSNWLESIVSAEPSPEFVVLMTDTVGLMFLVLDERARQIALLKLEGYRNEEISNKLGWSRSTVERKLRLIRTTWSSVADEASSVAGEGA